MDEVKQYKSLDDLKKIIGELEGIVTRPVVRGSHPTLYPEVQDGKYRTVFGVRAIDYVLSPDEKWVLPHNQKGLSFSSNWKELKRVHRMFSRVKTNKIDVHWVLEGADLPKDLTFVADQRPGKQGHYFLTVNNKIPIHRLVSHLKWVADRMSIIRSAERVL